MKHIICLIMPLCLLMGLGFPASAAADAILSGSGATFPQPLYKKWISEYLSEKGSKITYLGGGSGKGIADLMKRTVDFGASDAFMSDEEMKKLPGPVLHIPTCVGAVTIIYNLPGAFSLKLTPAVLTGIFSGKIKKWSDTAIAEINSEAMLPDYDITVIHRSEASGTTYILTDYFSKVNPEWRSTAGRGKQIRWPVGVGVESNQGVAEAVKKINGGIGYVELNYARNHSLPVILIQNKSGSFISPTLSAVSKAADVNIPADTRILITDTEAPEGYPISGFTWLICYRDQQYDNRSPARGALLGEFLWWAVHEGQKFNESLFYAPLPASAVLKAESIIRSLTYGDKHLLDP